MSTPAMGDRSERLAAKRAELDADWAELRDRWKVSIRLAFGTQRRTRANLDQACDLCDAIAARRESELAAQASTWLARQADRRPDPPPAAWRCASSP
jgi:hypothetical protein